MAIGAITLLQGGMDNRFVEADFILVVAFKTEVCYAPFQEKLGNDPVAKMALFAFILLDDRVHVLHGKIFIGKFRVAFNTPLAHEFFCRISRGRRYKADSAAKEQGRQEQGTTPHVRYLHVSPHNHYL
jgi:hypothetical protein